MKKLIFFFSAFALAQTLPTLAPVVAFTTETQTCVIEFMDGKAWNAKCVKPTGETVAQVVIEKVSTGSGFFSDEVLCMIDEDSNGKQKLSCAASGKVVIDGYTPEVTARKRRWFAIWR